MLPNKHFFYKPNFQLTVVKKLVIGFASLAILLIITSVLSYVGLRDIKHSAEEVAYRKMPIQSAVFIINEKVLNLARITTVAYFETERVALDKFKTEFDSLYLSYEESVSKLSALVSSRNSASLDKALTANKRYLSASEAMFASKFELLSANHNVLSKSMGALNYTDEASALMLDLSYLEGDSRDLESLIGMSTNIDNKLGLMLTNIKELQRELDPQKVADIIDTLDYNLSNVKVDADYARRVGEKIDDQGIFEMFDEQYTSMLSALKGDDGVFVSKNLQLKAQKEATDQRVVAVGAIKESLTALKNLSESVNKDALQGQQNILQSVQSSVVSSFIISIAGIVATATLAFIATRSIAKPLKAVNKRLRILSQGDLRQSLDETGDDEFSELAKNINELIHSLHTLIGSINEKESNLRVVAKKNIAMGDQSLKHVAEQQSHINTTSRNTQDVKHSSVLNKGHIAMADKQLLEAISQSDRIVSLVDQSVQQVSEQAVQAERSTEIVQRLEENSRKIGGILDVIKTIAEQTNLLALNAAIEAARAGESGRGFAVVADEVRTLATRTHDSTQEIESMIANLQADSEQAISAMSRGAEQVQKGVEITQEVTSQVSAIKIIIEGLAAVNRDVVAETENQDKLLDDVVIHLTTIVELSEKSAISTQSSNDATHQIAEQMDELRDAVRKFKLS